MNIQTIIDWVFIIVGVGFVFVPFERKRSRASWANHVLVWSGLLGVVKGVVCLFVDANWISLSQENYYLIDTVLRLVFDGFYLGVIWILMFSGQLQGTKRIDEEIKP